MLVSIRSARDQLSSYLALTPSASSHTLTRHQAPSCKVHRLTSISFPAVPASGVGIVDKDR